MILDSSVLVAIGLQEPGFENLLRRAASAPARGAGAPTVFETSMVLTGRMGSYSGPVLEALLRSLEVEVLPFGETHWREALAAYSRYGKGRHPAGLNFGDCLSYASAVVAGQPLFYIGNDFSQTDLATA